MKALELYIHIPFCVRKCKYCDFLSGPATRAEQEIYVESLCREICSYTDLAKAYRVVSIFLGGGTPSTLEAEQTESIFAAINRTFTIAEDAEITTELNPGTVDEKKLRAYQKCGINRLSIGLQSADDRELRMLGRIHTYEEFLHTYRLAKEVGFTNINIDLMSAISGQNLSDWERTLRTVAELSPEHISAYSLIIEEGTPFYEKYGNQEDELERGRRIPAEERLPDEDTERRMYWRTEEILKEYGYEHYEISNYAKPGKACRHNIGYWYRTEYLGIGTGAASLINNCRFTYEPDRMHMKADEKEILSVQEQMEETMFLGLRMMKGVGRKEFSECYGKELDEVYGDTIRTLKEEGLLEEKNSRVYLTRRGIDISNYVMSEFLK